MKSALIVLLLGLATYCQAQFPVQVANSHVRYANTADLARSEGVEISLGGRSTQVFSGTLVSVTTGEYCYSVASGNLNSYNSPPGVTVGHTIRHEFSQHVEGFYYSPSPIGGGGLMVNAPFGTTQFQGYAQQPIQRPFSQTLYPGQSFVGAAITSIYAPNNNSSGTSLGTVQSFTIAYSQQMWGNNIADANLFAPKCVDIWGDSIGAGIGPTDWRNTLAYLFREYWTTQGYNLRLRNRSASGSTTDNHLAWMNAGRYYYDPPAAVIIQVATNDASGVTTADNLKALIDKAIAMYTTPTNKVRIIIPAILPKGVSAAESLASTKRGQIKSMIQAHSKYNLQVFYIEGTGTAWTATDAAKYNAGDNVHPTDAASLLAWGVIKTYLDATPSLFTGK